MKRKKQRPESNSCSGSKAPHGSPSKSSLLRSATALMPVPGLTDGCSMLRRDLLFLSYAPFTRPMPLGCRKTKVSAASYPSSPCAANMMAGVRLDQYPSLVIQVGVVVPIGLGFPLDPLAMSSY